MRTAELSGSTNARVFLRELRGSILVRRAGEIPLAAGVHAHSARTHLSGNHSAISQPNLVCHGSPTDPEDKPTLVKIEAGWSRDGESKRWQRYAHFENQGVNQSKWPTRRERRPWLDQ